MADRLGLIIKGTIIHARAMVLIMQGIKVGLRRLIVICRGDRGTSSRTIRLSCEDGQVVGVFVAVSVRWGLKVHKAISRLTLLLICYV